MASRGAHTVTRFLQAPALGRWKTPHCAITAIVGPKEPPPDWPPFASYALHHRRYDRKISKEPT
jgi:hypothetical protein